MVIMMSVTLGVVQDPADEDKMLFCDLCDRGYHIYCVGLQGIPTGQTLPDVLSLSGMMSWSPPRKCPCDYLGNVLVTTNEMS